MTRTARPVQAAFYRLDGLTGWRIDIANSRDTLDDEVSGGLRLSGRSATTIPPHEPGGSFAGLTRPTGLAVGPDGRLFLADPNGNQILTYTTHDQAFGPLWEPRAINPPDAYTLLGPRGVALSRDGDLVVADTGHSRLIVYTWPELAPRTIIQLRDGEPWDVAFDEAGFMYVADPARGRVHRFDRLWRRDVTYDGGSGLLRRPRHLAFDADDRLYVVDDGLKLVVQLDSRGRPVPGRQLFGSLVREPAETRGLDGRQYVVDPAGDQIRTRLTDADTFVTLGELAGDPGGDAFTFLAPQGVAVSSNGVWLGVADTGRKRVILYRLPAHTPVRILSFSEASEPWDVAFDDHGNLYVVDRGAARVHRFGSSFEKDSAYDGGAGFLQSPARCAVDDSGHVYVRDDGLHQIILLDRRGQVVRHELLHRRVFPPAFRIDADGLWLTQDDRLNCPQLQLIGLEVDRRGRLRGEPREEGAYPALLARPLGPAFPREGRYISLMIDSGLFDCAWDRVVFDIDIPETTSITVRTLTSRAQLDPAVIEALPTEGWSLPLSLHPGAYPEVLVQSPPGRYLWLRVELLGSGQASPLIRAITLYAPRQSSLQYLPPIFHEDAISASFLDRFLSYFDTIFAEIESQVESTASYLDPDGVPSGEFLRWLASWLDVRFLAEWSDETRREFVRRAISLYRQRGTVTGLTQILQLHSGLTDPLPTIIEHFRLRDYQARRATGGVDLVDGRPFVAGVPLADDGNPNLAHSFTVVVPSQAASDRAATETLQRLIEVHKPAHTEFQLRVVQPGVLIGCQSTVGVDMLVGRYPEAPLGEMTLGRSSRLASPPSSGMRLGDSRLAFRV